MVVRSLTAPLLNSSIDWANNGVPTTITKSKGENRLIGVSPVGESASDQIIRPSSSLKMTGLRWEKKVDPAQLELLSISIVMVSIPKPPAYVTNPNS